MQPSSPEQPQHPLQPYDFILNPEKPAGKSKLPLSMPGPGSSLAQRLLFVAGGALILVIVVALVASLMFKGSSSSTDITNIAASQTEIIRVVALAEQSAKSPDTKAFAASTEEVVTSDLAALQAAANDSNIKINAKLLSSKKDSAVDTNLKTAAENGQCDEVFTQTLATKLKAYSREMANVFPSIKSKKVQAAMNSAYKSTDILVASQKTTSQ